MRVLLAQSLSAAAATETILGIRIYNRRRVVVPLLDSIGRVRPRLDSRLAQRIRKTKPLAICRHTVVVPAALQAAAIRLNRRRILCRRNNRIRLVTVTLGRIHHGRGVLPTFLEHVRLFGSGDDPGFSQGLFQAGAVTVSADAHVVRFLHLGHVAFRNRPIVRNTVRYPPGRLAGHRINNLCSTDIETKIRRLAPGKMLLHRPERAPVTSRSGLCEPGQNPGFVVHRSLATHVPDALADRTRHPDDRLLPGRLTVRAHSPGRSPAHSRHEGVERRDVLLRRLHAFPPLTESPLIRSLTGLKRSRVGNRRHTPVTGGRPLTPNAQRRVNGFLTRQIPLTITRVQRHLNRLRRGHAAGQRRPLGARGSSRSTRRVAPGPKPHHRTVLRITDSRACGPRRVAPTILHGKPPHVRRLSKKNSLPIARKPTDTAYGPACGLSFC
ncbi:MAG: hypothetical protein BWY06_03005 [Candidatus Latescibacteria bacterium ADurb.Bin168]|nr:MAG: hypothetical protein BWY06_03005 [Candidatus Latescibacteria bacterium ADurb.Bin168]